MASKTEQVWQGVGTDEDNGSISSELLQLDLATQPIQIDCCTTSRISSSLVELARYCDLSHNRLIHYQWNYSYLAPISKKLFVNKYEVKVN